MTWVPDCMSHLRKKSAFLYAITTYDNKQRTYRAPEYSVPPLLTDQTGWPSNIFKYIQMTTLRTFLNIQMTTLRTNLNIQ